MNEEQPPEQTSDSAATQAGRARRRSGTGVVYSPWLATAMKAMESVGVAERAAASLARSPAFTMFAAQASSPMDATLRDWVRAQKALRPPGMTSLAAEVQAFNDWHQRIAAIHGNVTLNSRLFEQVARQASFVLPDNLRSFKVKELKILLAVSAEDGISAAWAPRRDIVRGLLGLETRKERYAYLADHRDEALDDIEESLHRIDHPELTDWASLLGRAVVTARDGHEEAAQALAGNVLDSAMKGHGDAWMRHTFPQATPQGGRHTVLSGVLGSRSQWNDLSMFDFVRYLVIIGMKDTFGPGAAQDTFNRHLGAHRASYDSYRPEFVLPALLIAHAMLRALQQDLDTDTEEA